MTEFRNDGILEFLGNSNSRCPLGFAVAAVKKLGNSRIFVIASEAKQSLGIPNLSLGILEFLEWRSPDQVGG